jgi:beta-keto acid cleavage enzyme
VGYERRYPQWRYGKPTGIRQADQEGHIAPCLGCPWRLLFAVAGFAACLGPGKLAESNTAQVRAVRQIIEEMGPIIATLDEAREILKLQGRAAVGF